MARTLDKRLGMGLSRVALRVRNNLGIISTDQMNQGKKFRNPDLDIFDAYYEGRQYDKLMSWDEAQKQDEYVPIRSRKPRINYNLGKIIVDKLTAKLCGRTAFPEFVIEDDPDDTEFFRFVQKASSLRMHLVEPVRHCLISGASFVRFFLVDGALEMEWAHAKYCYPQFDAKGELTQIEIKYVFEDENDRDGKGEPKKKWYRLLLSQTSDILFNNPDYQEGSEPTQWEIVEQVDHNLGWVQGEWLRTKKDKFSPDGESVLKDILGFIDEQNYSLSQSSQAVGYNQEPQLTVNGMDEDEVETLIRSSQKAWNLGREGKAQFSETSMEGVKTAIELRDDMRHRMVEVVRVIMLDPEKIAGNAQSGTALEILHGPLVEFIDELRTVLEPSLRNLLIKIGMTLLAFEARGEETPIQVPPGYMPSSLDMTVKWPDMFPPTIEDISKKVAMTNTAVMGRLISEESGTRFVAKDFGIENIDEELQKIAAQPPPPSPFGGGF